MVQLLVKMKEMLLEMLLVVDLGLRLVCHLDFGLVLLLGVAMGSVMALQWVHIWGDWWEPGMGTHLEYYWEMRLLCIIVYLHSLWLIYMFCFKLTNFIF